MTEDYSLFVANCEACDPFAYFAVGVEHGLWNVDGQAVERVKPLLFKTVLGHRVYREDYDTSYGWVTAEAYTNISIAKYLLTTPMLMVVDVGKETLGIRDDAQSAILRAWEEQGFKLEDNPFYMGDTDGSLSS